MRADFEKSRVVGTILACALATVLFYAAPVYALNLERTRYYFLRGDYADCIKEGEKALAGIQGVSKGVDELYYLLGLSYLKDGNYLRAVDIFEIILNECGDSRYQGEATLGIGDAYFLKGDYIKARQHYEKMLDDPKAVTHKPAVYYRLALIATKTKDTQSSKQYAGLLKEEFPFSLEARLNGEFCSLVDCYYTVQVGSFSKKENAQRLTRELVKKGFAAYMEEAKLNFRVRVGKLSTQEEARGLKEKLSKLGYPTKIYP
ncbi:MAG: outer membrane protein assembly factor BamD [Candidatus Omnitrophota bacterium]|nr:MAG: outer membrane protein assembly factor BamD [Candidatus Omnitrophota bacterium]